MIESATASGQAGPFGKLLTNIFGVSDEVYEGIDILKHNQQKQQVTTQEAKLINSRITHSNLIINDSLEMSKW